jgi:hypothetical protein
MLPATTVTAYRTTAAASSPTLCINTALTNITTLQLEAERKTQ